MLRTAMVGVAVVLGTVFAAGAQTVDPPPLPPAATTPRTLLPGWPTTTASAPAPAPSTERTSQASQFRAQVEAMVGAANVMASGLPGEQLWLRAEAPEAAVAEVARRWPGTRIRLGRMTFPSRAVEEPCRPVEPSSTWVSRRDAVVVDQVVIDPAMVHVRMRVPPGIDTVSVPALEVAVLDSRTRVPLAREKIRAAVALPAAEVIGRHARVSWAISRTSCVSTLGYVLPPGDYLLHVSFRASTRRSAGVVTVEQPVHVDAAGRFSAR